MEDAAVETAREVFNQESARWKEETKLASSDDELLTNQSYLRIVGLGPAAIPLILQELKREPHFWFWALELITRAEPNPVPPEHLGDVEAMAKDWIEWGASRGYV